MTAPRPHAVHTRRAGRGAHRPRCGRPATLARLLEHRDLLLADPRGTGRSDALHCRGERDVGVALGRSFATECHDYPRAFSYADPLAARRAAYDHALDKLDPRLFRPFSPRGWSYRASASGAA